jgi:5-methylcytosine-specific restriction protein A
MNDYIEGRKVPEWIGKTKDSKPPERVRLRIFRRHDGRCCLSGQKIKPGDEWQLHHVKGIAEGGENRESNMAPALVEPHKVETARQMKAKAKADRVAKKHFGIKAPKQKIPSRPFPSTEVVRPIPKKGTLPPRPLFRKPRQ